MSIHRTAAKRDENEPDIMAALRRVGCAVQQISGEGVPDLLVSFVNAAGEDELILMEVKMPKAKLTEAQEKWWREWTGKRPVIVRSVEECLRLIGRID